ncbi:class I lanthipeptide [Taibaiella soli]|uniref:Uncharacterized protein n=1 Tax=Taibaiella soli TaxID=1649169 RepID=A0A2W2BEW6_9BACT|nr:class I lanthipeptide [Taibaiella soli]PZF74427.1 hypothetical protein DN068_02280 [Taibaiella soli]
MQTATVPVHETNGSAVMATNNIIAKKIKAMKKVKVDAAKLQLHKEKISNLTSQQMDEIKGGGILWSLIGCCKSVPPPVQYSDKPVVDSDCICIGQ